MELKLNCLLSYLIKFKHLRLPQNVQHRYKSGKQWLERQMSDTYVEQAKILNYRCRSAFKLLQIDEKAKFLTAGQTVVDIGAAPGSWTQVAVQKVNATGADESSPVGTVISIDKQFIYPIEGATIFNNMDFSTTEAHEKIFKHLNGRLVDVVLSDMAPSPTGVRELDKERIINLCYMALRFALQVSKVDGMFLFKVWDGKDVPVLETDLGRFYNQVRFLKPIASRTDSAEKFVLASGFKGIIKRESEDTRT